jgi:hypothetical protein
LGINGINYIYRAYLKIRKEEFIMGKIFGIIITIGIITLTLNGCAVEEKVKEDLDENIEIVEKDQIKSVGDKKEEKICILNSTDKIFKDFNNNKISVDEATKQIINTINFPNKLSNQYKNDKDALPMFESTSEYTWITNHLNELTKETIEEIQPFLLEPNDVNSFYYKERTETKGFSLFDVAYANSNYDSLTYSIGGFEDIVSINYYDSSVSNQENDKMKAKAQLVLEAVQKAWPMYKALTKIEPNKKINIYFTNMANPDMLGEARWQTTPEKYWINIRETIDGEKLKAVTVHELFHIFQYFFADAYKHATPDVLWLNEAIGTWAIHYVYPSNNFEHLFSDKFFETLDYDRLNTQNKANYSSYVFFLFLTQYTGDSEVIYNVMNKCKSGDVRNNLSKSITNYESVYGEFGVYNWDKDPMEAYQDTPTFPHKGAGEDSISIKEITERKLNKKSELLEKGACMYHKYDFKGDTLSKVIFDFNKTIEDKSLIRNAFVKIGDVWSREDWTELKTREFCMEEPSSKVQEVIICWANADLTKKINFEYELDTRGECEIPTNYTKITGQSGFDKFNMRLFYKSDEELIFDKELNYDEENESPEDTEIYVVKSRNAKFDKLTTGEFSSLFGVGNLNETYNLQEAPVKLVIFPDIKEGYLYVDPDKKEKDWISYSMVSKLWSDQYKDGIDSTGFENKIYLYPEDFTKDGIKGKRTVTIPDSLNFGARMEITLEFYYKIMKE